MFTSEAVTRGVRVQVQSSFDAARSDPSEGHWFFLYTVTITNESDLTVQLASRHWTITDGNNEVHEVHGPGVVGQQPVLAPGASFSYTSGCPLETPFGLMEGHYRMVPPEGEAFDARIAPFELGQPSSIH